MQTRVMEMFGLDAPIFAFSHCRDVVIEVSKAGGLGVLGISGFTPERLEEELQWIDDHINGKPYGVDILIPNRYEKAAAVHTRLSDIEALIPQSHRQFSQDLCDKGNIAPLTEEGKEQLRYNIEKTRMTPELAEELVTIALRHPVKLLVNALGTPPRERVAELQAKGIKVGSLIGKMEHAQAQAAAGVDIIIAQGSEAGGHTGQISSMVLWPQVVDAVPQIPVLAAGGIGRGRQVAAALALGADGVWCGSIWLGTIESELSEALRKRFYDADAGSAVQSRSITGKPCRMLKSKFSEAWDAKDAPEILPMPLQTLATAESRLRIEKANAEEYLSYPVGQVVGDMKNETSVRHVIYQMLDELISANDRLQKVVRDD